MSIASPPPRSRKPQVRNITDPPVRWLGGKRLLAPTISKYLPTIFDRYFEPFAGGLAVYWLLKSEERFSKAVLGDVNEDLMTFYQQVRDNVDALIWFMGVHQPHVLDENYYYSVREKDPGHMKPIERAARFLFLQRCSFNGLWRVNRKGQHNSAYGLAGKHARNVVLTDNLHVASGVLQGADLRCQGWEGTVRDAGPGDVVYLDPPYWPDRESGFVGYSRDQFRRSDHREMAEWAKGAVTIGVTVVASNHDLPEVRELWQGFKVVEVEMPRKINRDASKRGPVKELLLIGKPR